MKTNAGFLAEAVDPQEFWNGEVDTGFIPRHIDTLVPAAEPDDASGGWPRRRCGECAMPDEGEDDPWTRCEGFRLNAADDLRVALAYRGETRVIDRASGDSHGRGQRDLGGQIGGLLPGPGLGVRPAGARWRPERPAAGGDGAIVSPMPGKVIARRGRGRARRWPRGRSC